MNRGKKVYIEGTVGVGKSTVLQLLAEERGITVLPEPVEAWTSPVAGANLLQDAYEATGAELAPSLMRLQVLICSTLHEREEHANRIALGSPSDIVVLERAPSSALVFLDTNPHIDERDRAVLIKLVSTLQHCQREEGESILLTAAGDALVQRVRHRGRPEEAGITWDYIRSLDNHFRRRALQRGHTVIDTTSISPKRVASLILRLIRR